MLWREVHHLGRFTSLGKFTSLRKRLDPVSSYFFLLHKHIHIHGFERLESRVERFSDQSPAKLGELGVTRQGGIIFKPGSGNHFLN